MAVVYFNPEIAIERRMLDYLYGMSDTYDFMKKTNEKMPNFYSKDELEKIKNDFTACKNMIQKVVDRHIDIADIIDF